MSLNSVKVGLIGCGMISKIYLENARELSIFDVVACADVIPERAQARASEFGIPNAPSVDALLADPEIEIVLNLTIPLAHAEVGRAVLAAGKHLYAEKPLAVSRADGRQLLDEARSRGLAVGSAPDTFLGGGIQTCRKLIDDGVIGEPVAAMAFYASHGHEGWHPDPDFYYQPGAGPLFDMGPYYLTALVALLGPIRRVSGAARVTFPERTITSQPKQGKVITVNTPTHVSGTLEFQSGVIGTVMSSFDVWPVDLPGILIYGSEGTLLVPDPNTFGGPVRLRPSGASRDWVDVPLTHGNVVNSRGIGLADLAYALRQHRAPRASGALAYHILDTMQALLDTSASGQHVVLESQCERPLAVPPGLGDFTLEA